MGRGPIAMIDARDVADCALAALVAEDAAPQAWRLTGPRAITFAEIANRLSVPYVNVPLGLAARVMQRRGASGFEVEHSVRMAECLYRPGRMAG